jgi:C4-dicarboxylate-specific signal transduction histidine kinase
MVTVSMDYKELDDLAKKHFISNSLFSGFFPVILTVLLIYIVNLKKNLILLEKEQHHSKQVSELNKELEEDIEQRKILEKELIKSKTRFKQLFNAGSDLTFALYLSDHKQYQISQANEIAHKLLGNETLKGKNYLEYSDFTSEHLDSIVELLAHGEEQIFESSITTVDGVKPVEISAQTFMMNKEEMLLLVARNIEQKKIQEEQLEKNRGLLIYKFRMVAMGEMIANIAHQWRQPLGRMSLMLTNLKDMYEHNELEDGDFDGSVSRIQRIIKQMSGIIDEFRYFFNPNQERALFAIKDQIDITLEMLKDRIAIGEVNIQVEQTEHFVLFGYSNQLSQVLLNILNNSLDAVRTVDIPLIKVEVSKTQEAMSIRIWNNGPPLNEGDEEKVFDPYFTTKSDRDGTGIGLYMTKMIIESNFEGRIKMSNYEEGVETLIEIPISEDRYE